MGGLKPNKVVLKRKHFAVDEDHPNGTLEQIDYEVRSPNAGEDALSPLQLEPHELTKYMRMRHDRREERRMQRNQHLLGRHNAALANKRQPSAQRLLQKLEEENAPANPLKESRDMIKDSLEKGEKPHVDEEFFKKYC